MQLSSGSRSVNFCLNHHQHPYYMYASNECPEETARARKLVLAFATVIHTCDKYQHFMNWLIFTLIGAKLRVKESSP